MVELNVKRFRVTGGRSAGLPSTCRWPLEGQQGTAQHEKSGPCTLN